MRLSDERLKEIESWAHKITPLNAPIIGEQIGSMALELLLLRKECRAWRSRNYAELLKYDDSVNPLQLVRRLDETSRDTRAAMEETNKAGFAP